ncbi:MAG TPA: DUF3019 domain-containing protein [Steroidobacteraceae bacterium]|nr:DUF3019 domain-containing protein [Steroidobacteraceae bacterium]
MCYRRPTDMMHRWTVPLACLAWLAVGSATASAAGEAPIQLQLSPRICTLAARDKQCQTEVHARWSAPHEESLCLVIVDRPDVKRCWEHYEQGTYNIELTFVDDLTFQLRDPELRNVLASEVLRVIREALRYRHKRRDPWNIFE